MRFKTLTAATAVLLLGAGLSACSSSSSSSSTSPGGSSSAAVPQINAADFTADFALMKELTGLASQGQGMIGVLLPDTTTSTRYVQYDAPYLTQAFEAAGLSSDQFKIDNAQGSASTMQTQAEADINAGASVLLVDPLDPGSGAAIESKAEAAGVKVIDYDRLVTGGPADRYYVSFNNVEVGKLIGQGEVDCIAAWNVKDPNILIMDGDPTDNNAKLFAQGYNGVLKPYFDDGTYTKVGEPPGTWDPSTAATTFEQQYTAHPNINAVITPNDDNANAVVSVLKKNNIQANTFPTTGPGRLAPGPAEHPDGLPVRHGLQADLPRGAGRRRARALPARGGHASVDAGERDDARHGDRQGHRVRLHDAALGHLREHGRHGGQGRRRQGVRAVCGQRRKRLHEGGDKLALHVVVIGPHGTRGPIDGLPRERGHLTDTVIAAEGGPVDIPAGSEAEPLLRLRGITKTFGPVRALFNVDLDIPGGQVTALAGDNGAGKSVLIKCIAGIHAPDAGQMWWAGEPVHVRTPRDAAALGIETVYQDLALCDNLDIVQNMFLGRERVRRSTLDEESMEQAANETLASLKVTTVRSIRQPVASLSGGQRQSVAIAKAVLWNSKLVIMDEPTAALGVTQTAMVLELVRRLADKGHAVLMVSHNMNDVFQVADRIAVLHLGQMAAVRPIAEMDRQIVVDLMTTGVSTRSAPRPSNEA